MSYHFLFTVSLHVQILLQIRWEINKATDFQSVYGAFYSVLIVVWIYFPAVSYFFLLTVEERELPLTDLPVVFGVVLTGYNLSRGYYSFMNYETLMQFVVVWDFMNLTDGCCVLLSLGYLSKKLLGVWIHLDFSK